MREELVQQIRQEALNRELAGLSMCQLLLSSAIQVTERQLQEIRELAASVTARIDGLKHFHPDGRHGDELFFFRVSIEDLEVSDETAECLVKGGIDTLQSLLYRSEADLMRLPGFGPDSLEEVRSKLQVLRLHTADYKP